MSTSADWKPVLRAARAGLAVKYSGFETIRSNAAGFLRAMMRRNDYPSSRQFLRVDAEASSP
ncbi:MAG: hypothetical protein IT426_07855 [Pirellulales bacterium]|nr:hypothetical protein [Pirellulales bacterium]